MRVFKAVTFQAFELDAHRVVVAVAAAPVMRLARVPCPVVGADKLPKGAIAPDIKMRRDFQSSDLTEIRVCIPIQSVGEQRLHFVAAVLPGRQADGVEDDQVDAGPFGARAEVGRSQVKGGSVPAVFPKVIRAGRARFRRGFGWHKRA